LQMEFNTRPTYVNKFIYALSYLQIEEVN
jgi:hypothetical protein